MNLPQAHGNKTRRIFWYCNNCWVAGNFVGLSGSGAGQKRWFCAAIIHNGVIGFFIGFIPSWKLKKTINYMLCIIALSWLFSGASFLLFVGGLKQWFWKNITVKEGLIAKNVTEKDNEAWIVRKPQKRPCKPWGTNGGDFLWLGIVPCGAARNYLTGEAWLLFFIIKKATGEGGFENQMILKISIVNVKFLILKAKTCKMHVSQPMPKRVLCADNLRIWFSTS